MRRKSPVQFNQPHPRGGIAQLLSAQILAGQYERQKALLTQSEIKLLHAQVNPHFLFNALNTLKAVIRRDSDQAGQLVQYLSTFFRKNLKRPTEIVTLADEIEHVNAYLQIEKARFQANLQIQMAVPEGLAHHQLPAFTLQPIVENAIKHGTSQHLGVGEITIRASQDDRWLQLDIEDNAGLYRANPPGQRAGDESGGQAAAGAFWRRLRHKRHLRAGALYPCHPTSGPGGECMLRVLIVDDEPLARVTCAFCWRHSAISRCVGECGNAVEAIGAVHKLRPDVLFLDIQMPRISGLEMVGMLDPSTAPISCFHRL